MDKDLIEVYRSFTKYKINAMKGKLCLKIFIPFPNKIHQFYDGNGRTSTVLFANGNKIIKFIH